MAIRTYKVTLDSKNAIAPEPVYLRQGDKTGAVVIDATLMDNGSPVSLSGLTPMFKANTADGQAVIADSTGFTVTDSVNGKFTYQVPNALSSVAGKVTTAYFSFIDSYGSESTYDLAFIISSAVDITQQQAEDYITIIDGTIDALEDKMANLKTDLQTIVDNYSSGDFYNKSETDNRDAATLSSAKKYADSGDSNSLYNAKKYTDNSLSGIVALPETFANLAAIKAKYPNGSNGVMVAADNGNKYIWNGSSWSDAGVYQAVGLSNGSVTNPKLGDDVRHRLYAYADSIKKMNRVVDPDFVLGVIDPSTHLPNVSDSSIKIHSRPLDLTSGKVLKITTPSTANCTIYYYNQGSYVATGSLFKEIGYTDNTINADEAIIVCGYSGDTTMTSASDLGDQVSIVSLNDRNLASEVSSISDILGIEEVNFAYTTNITTGVGVGNVVDLTQQRVTNYKSALISCSEGDFYLINGTGGNNPRLWAFLNSNNQVITCADTNATESWLLLVAPKGASTLVLNQSTDLPCFKIPKNLTQGMSVNYKEFIQNKSIQLGKYIVGQTVDITPQTTTNYRYIMLSCKDGDRFKLTGRGGNNPRLYGFLDANNVLLKIADLSTQLSVTTSVITAPKNATTAVFNFQFPTTTDYPYSGIAFSDSDINSTVLETQSSAVDYSKYPKPQCPQLSEDYMASFVGGQIISNDMFAKPLGDLAISTDLMAHCSSFRLINGNIYAAFYVNKQAAVENPAQHTAVFRRASLSNLSSITNVDLCDIGDSVLGQTVNAIYDTVILKKDDDNDNLYLLFTAKLGADYYLLYRKYTISTDTLSGISKCQFTVNTTTNDFSIPGMKQALDANSISYPAFSTDISFMQQLSTRVENGVTYYYTGIGVLDFCFIAKSSDLINWIFVSQPDFPTTSKYEPAVYVLGDVAYYLCRQEASSSYAFLTTYNLVTHVWATPINIPDCQSRSVFFVNSGALYALHAPKDRNHIAILHINTTNLDQSADIAVANVDNMFYPFIQQNDDGWLYVTITQARKHIWLCKFWVPDTRVSIAKLKQVLGS